MEVVLGIMVIVAVGVVALKMVNPSLFNGWPLNRGTPEATAPPAVNDQITDAVTQTGKPAKKAATKKPAAKKATTKKASAKK